jgi:hypothetical protein
LWSPILGDLGEAIEICEGGRDAEIAEIVWDCAEIVWDCAEIVLDCTEIVWDCATVLLVAPDRDYTGKTEVRTRRIKTMD